MRSASAQLISRAMCCGSAMLRASRANSLVRAASGARSGVDSIRLSITIPPEEALRLRHTDALGHAASPFDVDADDFGLDPDLHSPHTDAHDPNLTSFGVPSAKPMTLKKIILTFARYPRTQLEYIVCAGILILFVPCLGYILMLCYGVMCPKSYHKYKAKWARNKRRNRQARYFKQIKDAVPYVLEGHLQVSTHYCIQPLCSRAIYSGPQLACWGEQTQKARLR